MAEVEDKTAQDLVLGWKVTRTGEPSYWLDSGAAPGSHSPGDLVRVKAASLGTHIAIVAQSGSGKSHLLGRLIEELAIATKARCLLLDPNADFIKISRPLESRLWREAHYDPVKRRGNLPHDSYRQFRSRWARMAILVRSNRAVGGRRERIKIWWPNIASDLLAEDVDPMRRSEVYHCHSFVGAVAELVVLVDPEGTGPLSAIDAAERMFSDAQRSRADLLVAIDQLFPRDVLARAYEREWSDPDSKLLPKEVREELTEEIDSKIKRIEMAVSYVSTPVGRYYFAKAREYEAAGVLHNRPPSRPADVPRITELDLASLPDKNTRMLVTSAALGDLWRTARRDWRRALARSADKDERVPTFVVVDEAHNLVPAEPRGTAESAVREQFRTIVAEGRKYGLFLILASQRPDKLDPLVLSECENKAIMRLSSGSVLAVTQKLLGLDDVPGKLLEKCLEFEIGRALLAGPWASDGPTVFYTAARRTVEGGRNLRPEHWATPVSPP